MVKTSQVYEDLDEICRLTNSIYFNHARLTSENLTPCSIFNLDDFLDKTKKLLGDDYIGILKRHNIIRPAPYGLYHINFNPDQHRGTNYNIAETGCRIFFFTNDRTFNNKATMYHEAAHSLQSKQDLFNRQKISKIYDFLNKGLKIAANNPLVEFAVDETCYKNYLQEMHSEAFAAACMLMRSRNAADFSRTAVLLMQRSANRVIEGLKSKDLNYPSSKYYASLPVMKATIKKVHNWRKNGYPDNLFDGNRIDFEQLSLLTAQNVWETAYTPQVFKQYMNKEWFLRRDKTEKGWEKDAILAIPFHSVNWAVSAIDLWNSNKAMKSATQVLKNSIDPLFEKLTSNDDESNGINFLRNAESILYFYSLKDKTTKNMFLSLLKNTEKALSNGTLLPLETIKEIFYEKGIFDFDEEIQQITSGINKQLNKNKQNEWLKGFIYDVNQNCPDDFEASARLRNIYDEKNKHPEKTIFNKILFTCDREDISDNENEVKNTVLDAIAETFYADKPYRSKLSKLIGAENFAKLEQEMLTHQHADSAFLFRPAKTENLKETYRPSFVFKGKKTYYPDRSSNYKNYSAAFYEEICALQNLYFENNDSRFFRDFMKKMEKMSNYNAETISATVKNERRKLISVPVTSHDGGR